MNEQKFIDDNCYCEEIEEPQICLNCELSNEFFGENKKIKLEKKERINSPKFRNPLRPEQIIKLRKIVEALPDD